MFAAFFYLLRQRGLHVSLNEWMTLLEGMEKGLHHSTLTGFYHLCRAIVMKNETEFDHFDQIFLEFFITSINSSDRSFGCDVIKRIQRSPSICSTCCKSCANVIGLSSVFPYEFTF